MSTTGLEVFDTTVQKTNRWLKDVADMLGEDDRHTAYLALRATLHALRDRLITDEVAHLGAQLPMLIRGFYYEGWDPGGRPNKQRSKEEFLARIEREFADGDPELVARAAFAMLASRIAEGEIEDVKSVLPHDLRELWP